MSVLTVRCHIEGPGLEIGLGAQKGVRTGEGYSESSGPALM